MSGVICETLMVGSIISVSPMMVHKLIYVLPGEEYCAL